MVRASIRARSRGAWLAGLALLLAAGGAPAAVQQATVSVDVNSKGVPLPPMFYGLMTEEINHSYDGGLYAELIQNRTFQDPLIVKGRVQPGEVDPPLHWSLVQTGNTGAKISLDKSDPVTSALPVSLKLDLNGGQAGVANDGYWGIPVRPNTRYTIHFFAKGVDGFTGPVTASIVTDDGNATVASAQTSPISTGWQKYELTFTTGSDAPTTSQAKFVLSASGNGGVEFSLVSLFPPTYENVTNGLRPDLMRLMAGLHPSFIRLPGGNYLEGNTFDTRFNWKHMIGPEDQRPGHMGCWGYRSSDGFGLPQYLLWCKQLGAEPVLAVFAGYVLSHHAVAADSPEMQQYVQEALQEIEYVSGPADSEWGKRRAADGLPEPFKLHYVEIGNEDWFDRGPGSYDARFTAMAKAIRAKYPELKLIATSAVKSLKPDLYDDHYYRSAVQMASDSGHYDISHDLEPLRYSGGRWNHADRASGTKVFVGEWATREGKVTSTLNAALGDSAWLIGMERNADVISMQCYAPLLVNVNPGAWQWRIDLIGYNAMSAFGSVSYYAQSMFAQNKGDVVLPTKVSASPSLAATEPVPHGAIGVGTWHTAAEYKDITVTAPDGQVLLKTDLTKDSPTNPPGWTFTGDKWSIVQGALKPSALDSETWGTIGNTNWTNYTLTLKARKTAGNEGFLILFHVTDGDNYIWWNVGGWRNTRTQMQAKHDWNTTSLGEPSDFTVQTGKWYDLKVEVNGHHFKCYADGKLISEASEGAERISTPLFAGATYDNTAHEVILKVVNFGSDPVDAAVDLTGAGSVTPTGKAWVLTGSPNDENTIAEPTKVSPKEEQLNDAAKSFRRSFAPHSLTLLRIAASP